MFTTERGQFFSASQNGYEADLPFIEKYVRPAATRDMATGLKQEAELYAARLDAAYKEDPLGFKRQGSGRPDPWRL